MNLRSLGFTLIELIIVIAIILLMAVVSIPAYQNYGARSELSLKADEIKALIDRAEAYSRNPQQGKDCAQVNLAPSPKTISFGKYNATDKNCSITPPSSVSSKDMIDVPLSTFEITYQKTNGTKINNLTFLPSIYSYYPGIFGFSDGANGLVVTLKSLKTGTSKIITIIADPYSVKITE